MCTPLAVPRATARRYAKKMGSGYAKNEFKAESNALPHAAHEPLPLTYLIAARGR
jgi:hypothetical protein